MCFVRLWSSWLSVAFWGECGESSGKAFYCFWPSFKKVFPTSPILPFSKLHTFSQTMRVNIDNCIVHQQWLLLHNNSTIAISMAKVISRIAIEDCKVVWSTILGQLQYDKTALRHNVISTLRCSSLTSCFYCTEVNIDHIGQLWKCRHTVQ